MPLSIIFERSMTEGILPRDWKSTHITPIFKKGSRQSASNYRPINVTSIAGKIMESVIKDTLMKHLQDNNCLIPSQHGFIPGRSCTTNLIEYLNVVTEAVDDGLSYDVILCDFQKAFDKVPFDGMIAKAKAHGICGELINWITDWTKDRRQRVVLNGAESSWECVLSSVVQGSVLGPILFLIYINCIDIAIQAGDMETFVSKYADDTKLGRVIKNKMDSDKLQAAVDRLVNWCNEWDMSLHPDKCVVWHFGRQNPKHIYHIGNQNLSAVTGAKDLGVYVSNTCKMSSHINNISKRAHAVLSQVRRATTIRDSHTFPLIYKSFVRPLLESAAPVWNPIKREDVITLEKVQR